VSGVKTGNAGNAVAISAAEAIATTRRAAGSLVTPKPPAERLVLGRPGALADVATHYCPGCGHGIVHRLVAEAIDSLGVRERAILVAPVGCAVFAYNYVTFDAVEAPHGRAPAVATGVKRVRPDLFVFTYQGDGDLGAIGTGEIVHAAARGENIGVIFVNNAVYGMTGGQMAPTTLPGQKTTSSPEGRGAAAGNPLHVGEMLATLAGPAYIARVSVHSPKEIRRAGAAIRRAFQCQVGSLGFALVEVLAPCPTNWGLSPNEAAKWIETTMVPHYPLGELLVSPRLVEFEMAIGRGSGAKPRNEGVE
jgi:2-oxoglutarate/2-oxoacid ferredoxin oxidoreductase subunit beta